MSNSDPHSPAAAPVRRLRWWPALLILLAALGAIAWIRLQGEVPFQKRNLRTLGAGLIAFALLLLWWLGFSRARWRLRLGVFAVVIGVIGASAALFRIRGVSGDLRPIVEARWRRGTASPSLATGVARTTTALATPAIARPDFPQFLGPHRTAILDGPALDPDWATHPPQILWRQPIGAAWSGFAVVGNWAITQEQQGDQELVTCYDDLTGQRLWAHGDAARYATTIAGEGPRCTPTVVSNHVFTFGATGRLNCLDLATGRLRWTHDLVKETGAAVPEWGFSGSPLVRDGRVIVGAGGPPAASLVAYQADDGQRLWSGGEAPISYGSPVAATLAGVPQILAFNSGRITAHDDATGAVLWEYPWGVGQPHVSAPIVVGSNRVVFSSGYGVGSELLEVNRGTNGSLAVSRVWQSKKMKAKFANLVQRDGFLYGLDDGMFACVDLRDGSQRWKEGRYGHGQGLLVRDLFLLMAEDGELVLLRPTPSGPNELHRFRVFTDKTWNPIALAGDLLLVRNDQAAACLRVALAK